MVEEVLENTGEEQQEETKKEKSRINIKTAYDALQPQEPIKWIVDNLVSEGSVNVFYGEPGIGKTWAMISLAIHVADGKDWLGFKIPEAKNVLIIDEESGEKRLLYRLRCAIRGERGNGSTPLFTNSLAGFQLDVPKDMTLLKNTIDELDAKLVIIDSLSTCMSGDENSKKDVQPVFNNLRKLASRSNCAIIIIHHSNKKGGYRGSSAINGSVDLMFKVEKDNRDVLEFSTEKTRDIQYTQWDAQMVWEQERFFLKQLNETPFQEEKKPEPKEENLPASQKYVLDYLVQHGDSKRKEIMNSHNNPETIKKAIEKLVQSGRIERKNEGVRGVEAIYGMVF